MATSANKSYNVGPDDGWVLVLDATTVTLQYLRIACAPVNTPFYVYAGTAAPTATSPGFQVQGPIYFEAYTGSAGNSSKFWVKVTNQQNITKARIDVYADGGTLA